VKLDEAEREMRVIIKAGQDITKLGNRVAFVRLGRAFPPALPTLARVRF